VRTECGATGTVAFLYQTAQAVHQLRKEAGNQKEKDKLDHESKQNISTTLTSLSALKQKKPDGYWLFLSLQSSQQELLEHDLVVCGCLHQRGVENDKQRQASSSCGVTSY